MADPAPPISAYIRTLNEARMIGAVVTAALACCDEVVVIDSGSTDDTVAIARAAGARIVVNAWPGNGHQKRVGEEACRHDWLLDLDADEIVSPALAAEIASLFNNGGPVASIYKTPMTVVPPFQPHARFGTVQRAKLYDRRVIRQPADSVWDQFEIPKGARVGALREPLLHYAYRDADHLTAKLNSYSSLQAREKPPKSRGLLALRIVFGFPFYFLRRFIFEGMFLKGVYGFAFTAMTAHGRWLRDVKMYERRLVDAAAASTKAQSPPSRR